MTAREAEHQPPLHWSLFSYTFIFPLAFILAFLSALVSAGTGPAEWASVTPLHLGLYC